MLASLYKVDKLRERVDETIKYFSPIGMGWFYAKVIIVIGINVKPISSMLSFHEDFECEGFNDDKACWVHCSQRYGPISSKDFWNLQIFVTLLPFVFFQSFTRKHIERNSAEIDVPYPSFSKFKLKQRTVNFQKVEKFAEDRMIRITKLVTLFTQLFLEVASLISVADLQRRRYNTSRDELGNQFIDNFGNFTRMIFLMPEQYRCHQEDFREKSYFGFNWDTQFHGYTPCNSAADHSTCWTTRNVESSFIQAILVGLLILGLFTNIGEIVYILGRSIKPAYRLTKKLSNQVQNFARKDDQPFKVERIYTEQMVRDEIRASNYNLHRQMSPELPRNRNKRSSNNNHEGNQVLQLFEYTGNKKQIE